MAKRKQMDLAAAIAALTQQDPQDPDDPGVKQPQTPPVLPQQEAGSLPVAQAGAQQVRPDAESPDIHQVRSLLKTVESKNPYFAQDSTHYNPDILAEEDAKRPFRRIFSEAKESKEPYFGHDSTHYNPDILKNDPDTKPYSGMLREFISPKLQDKFDLEFPGLYASVEKAKADEESAAAEREARRLAIGSQPDTSDLDLQIAKLAKAAEQTKNPNLLEAISVLAASLNPRMGPQGVASLARQMSGEPERMAARQSLEKLTAIRGKERESQANVALKRQLGELAAGSRIGAAQIGQQGAMQRFALGEQGRNARASMVRPPSITQQLALLKSVTQPIGRLFRDLDIQTQELERGRSFLTPEAYQQRRALIESERTKLNRMRRDAILRQIEADQVSPDVAGAFMTQEGIPLPGSEEALKVQEMLQKNANMMQGQR